MKLRNILRLSLVLGVLVLLAMTVAVLWLRFVSTAATIHSSAAREQGTNAVRAARLTVRVASYNAWLLPIGADDMDERQRRMGPAIDALEPDLLCLQEVWTGGALEPVADALADRLPDVARSGGGLAVLSRWPITRATFHEFPASTAPSFTEWLARKGVLHVEIETPAGPVRVLNSHLAFVRRHERDRESEQLSILLDIIGQDGDTPTVLCADLNLRSRRDETPTEAFLALRRAGLEDAASVDLNGSAARRQGTRVGWPREDRRAGWDPDYLMFRSGRSASLAVASFRQALHTPQTALSDHNLLLADFVLEALGP